MKKVYVLLLAVLGFATGSIAQSGIFESYAILDIGAGNAYYDLQATTGNPDFQGTNLGSFVQCSGTLQIKGAQNKTFKCAPCDITNSTLFYRVYPTGSPSGAFIPVNLNFFANLGGGGCGNDQQWDNVLAGSPASINLLAGRAPGNYTLEVYTEAAYTGCGSGTHSSNNGGANYKATFDVTLGASCPILVTSTTGSTPFATYTSLQTGGATSAITKINDLATHTGTIVCYVNAGYTETPTARINLTATGTLANPITFQKSGTGANPLITAYVGTSTPGSAAPDGIWSLQGSDYVTIDGINLTDPNAANPATMEYGYGLFKNSVTDGCQNVTIRNCTVTLNRQNFANGSAPMVEGSVGILVINSTPIAATTALTITNQTGANSRNKFYTNTVQNSNYGFALIGFAAASPYNLADTLNDIGGTSAGTGNQILNFGGGTGSTNPAAGVRTLAQYGLNVSYNTVNNNNGSGVNHPSTLRGIYTNTAAGANETISSNIITLTSGAATSQLVGVENIAGSTANSNTIAITGNTVNTSYPASTTGLTYGIYNNGASPSNLNVSSNTMSLSTSSAGAVNYFIYNTAAGAVVNNIDFNNNTITSATFTGAPTSSFRCIYNLGGATTAALRIRGNSFSNFTMSTASTAEISQIYNSATVLNDTIENNQFINLTAKTSSNVYNIYNNYTAPAGGTKCVRNNSIVTGFTRGTGVGTAAGYGYFDNGSSPTGVIHTISGNNFSNVTYPSNSTGSFTGIQSTDFSGSNPGLNVFNNTIKNITIAGTGTVTGINISGFAGTAGSPNLVYGNVVDNLNGGGTVTGIVKGSTSLYDSVYNNTVTNLNTSSTTASIIGINNAGGTNSGMSGNIINNLKITAGAGAGNLTGITISGGTLVNVYKNKIDTLINSGSGGSCYGINATSGTTVNIANNFVSNLQANSNTLSFSAIFGIANTGFTNANIFYNTVYLGSAAPIAGNGATGIQYYNSATSNVIKNNILNLQVTAGAGNNVAAIRRSSAGTANTAPGATLFNANNNIYYVPNAVNNYLYVEGTANLGLKNGYGVNIGIADDPVNNLKNDANFNTGCGVYKSFMAGNGENATFTENILGAGPSNGTFVPSGSSYSESNATTVIAPAITDDYVNAVRGATPDVGALQFAGIAVDAASPSIAYTALPTSTVCTTPPTLSVTISDPSLVNVVPGTKPRLWYKKGGAVANLNALPGTNDNTTDGWKWVEATNAVSPFTFTFDYTIVNGGVAVGDSITYFIVAQDNAGIPNVGSNAVTYAPGYCPATVALAAGAFPATGALKGFKILALPVTNATATPITVCRTGTSSLNLSVPVTGVSYQWQSSPAGMGTFTDIAGATTVPYTATVTASTDYRCNFYCGVTLIGSTATNATVTVTGPAITYAALPYAQDFETWTNGCSTTDIPTSDWVGSPVTGNNSWRRDDLGADAAWGNVASYIYSPVFSTGAHSARFHAGQASDGSVGTLDLNINMSTSGGNAILSFDHINTSGTDSLVIQYSINGGATFVRLDSLRSGRAVWTGKSINLTGIVSATTIIRFRAIADFGSTDIGLDNVQILVPCTGSPTSGSITGSAALCIGNSGTTLTSTGATAGVGITHHWAYSTTPGGPYTALGTALTQATGALAVTTYFIDTVRCTGSGLFTVTPEFTVTVNPLPATTTVSGAGTFCTSTTINAANGADGTMYFQGTTSGGTSTATPATSAVITASGTYYFRAQSAAGCWGVEGSAAVVIQTSAVITTTPAVVCLSGSGTIAASSANSCAGFVNSGTTLSGTFTATDLQALRPTTSIVNTSTCSFDATILRGYQAQQFQVNTSGTYTFDMTSTDDGMAYITSGAFVPGSCGAGTWIKGDDDSGPGNDPQLSMPLTAGITYTLYSTTYSLTSGTSTAAYSWTITPPSGGQLMLPAAGNIEWYTTASGGTAIGTGSPFNPVGVAGSPLANTNTAGTTVFYAACSNAPACRTPVNFIITSAATNVVLATTSTNGMNLPAGCDEGTWTYYKDPTDPTKYLFGVDWGSNAAAKAAAIPKLQLDAVNGSAEDIPGLLATYTMKRYWDIDLNGSTISAPVSVRFFYDAAEKASITAQRDAFITANGGVPRAFQWFKVNNGSTFVPATNVTPSLVTNSISLIDVTGGTGILNGIPYAQFDGLTGFSGGTGTIGVGGSPLPIKVEYFRGAKQNNSHVLDWKVVPVNTTSGTITLERSSDSRNFTGIYSITATALRMQQAFTYTSTNPLNGMNYYRLKLVDDNGVVTYSSIVALTNASKGLEFVNITPNPVTEGRFKLNIASAEKVKMEIIITDVTGRIMLKQTSNLIAGFNAIDMNVNNLANGVYQVFGNTADGKTRVLQFVKQ